MAHFMTGCRGSRQGVTRLAGKDSAPSAFVQGWDSGVEIIGGNDADGDYFEVYGNGGSNGRLPRAYIGRLRGDGEGFKFTPYQDAKGAA